MKRILSVVVFALLVCNLAIAETAAARAGSAATVLNEIMAAPDKGIPEEILGSAKCVAVVPSLIKGGFVFGGAHGRGMATCRTADGWSAPAPFSMTGGSFGLQIGVQGVDLVMMIMNDRGMQALLSSKFKLGADASAAAGPVGRHAEGSTDWKMRAEVLTYSRARGLFAGITVNGSSITQDDEATRELYGRQVPFKTILTGAVATPQTGESFVSSVRKATATSSATTAAGTTKPAPVHLTPIDETMANTAPAPAKADPAPAPAPKTTENPNPAPAAQPATTTPPPKMQ
jgi:lipid-binding SYLF domain-containing protein